MRVLLKIDGINLMVWMKEIFVKPYSIGKDLVKWIKNNISKIEEVVKNTRTELENIKLKPLNLDIIKRELELSHKLEEYLIKEEDMWRQKSREIWLKEGDKNNKFLHSITLKRRRSNRINKIKNGEEKWLNNREEIGTELCNHLQNILTSSGLRDIDFNWFERHD